ncbi:MAG: TRAP transporter large permease subunit, partial [Mitsuokella sp.]
DWTLRRNAELLRSFVPWTFIGNHDTTRIASQLSDERRAPHALALLMTLPGTPAIIQMGVPVLCAHMFVFYFGIIADVTPPVALAAFAGAGIAGGNPLRTGINASKLAIAAFIIPYMFVLSPNLLMIDATALNLIMTTVTALVGMIALSSALIGFLADKATRIERIVLIIAGLLLIKPGIGTDVPGFVLFAIILAIQMRRSRARKAEANA